MILPFISERKLSGGEPALAEFGDLEDLVLLMLLMFGMVFLVLCFVIVFGPAMIIRCAHIHVTGMFAGAAAVCGHATSPALAIAGGGFVGVLQGFVFDVRIGVGRKGPDFADLFVHVIG